MKLFTTFFLFFCLGVTTAQEALNLNDLNHIADPKTTDIQFNFGDGLAESTPFQLYHRTVLDEPSRIDTTLAAGTKTLKVKMPLEIPSLIRIRFLGLTDKLYALPGIPIEVSYPELAANNSSKIIGNNPALQAINDYYVNQYELLGISGDIGEAYSKYRGMGNLEKAEAAYDSLADVQLELLEQSAEDLPAWFVELEEKNIIYCTMSFKLTEVAARRYQSSTIEVLSSSYQSIIDQFDTADEKATLSIFYSFCLQSVSYLKHCTEKCYEDGSPEAKSTHLRIAGLRFGKSIENKAIRSLYFAQTLMLLGTRQLERDIMEAYQEELIPVYRARINKHINPSLNGKPAPNFYLQDIAGEFYGVKKFRGKIVLLNFWFVGCAPCMEEIEHEKKLVKELENRDFVLVNICTTSTEEAWRKSVARTEMPGINLYAKGNWNTKIQEAYAVKGFPTYVLIDRTGTVISQECQRPSSKELINQIRAHLD